MKKYLFFILLAAPAFCFAAFAVNTNQLTVRIKNMTGQPYQVKNIRLNPGVYQVAIENYLSTQAATTINLSRNPGKQMQGIVTTLNLENKATKKSGTLFLLDYVYANDTMAEIENSIGNTAFCTKITQEKPGQTDGQGHGLQIRSATVLLVPCKS